MGPGPKHIKEGIHLYSFEPSLLSPITKGDIQEDALDKHRAWLGIGQVHMDKLEAGITSKLALQICNTGSMTGTMDAQAWSVTLRPSDSDVRDLLELICKEVNDKPEYSRHTDFPPSCLSGIADPDGITLNAQQLESIQTRTLKLWIVGCFYYRDNNNVRHSTKFCLYYDPQGGWLADKALCEMD